MNVLKNHTEKKQLCVCRGLEAYHMCLFPWEKVMLRKKSGGATCTLVLPTQLVLSKYISVPCYLAFHLYPLQ